MKYGYLNYLDERDYIDIATIEITPKPEFEIKEVSEGYIIVYSLGEAMNVMYQTAITYFKEHGLNKITGIRILDKNLVSGRFIGLDIIMSLEKEGIVQATITAITSAGITYFLGNIAINLLKFITKGSLSNPYVLLAYIIVAVAGYHIGKAIDAGYVFLRNRNIYIKYNEREDRLMLHTDIEDAGEIAQLIQEMGAYPELYKYLDGFAIKQTANNNEIIYLLEKNNKIDKICENNKITKEKLFELNPWLKERIVLNDEYILINQKEYIKLADNVYKRYGKAEKYIPKVDESDYSRYIVTDADIKEARRKAEEKYNELEVKLLHNGKDVSKEYAPQIFELKYYDDIMNDSCDVLNIKMYNKDNLFQNTLYPKRYDKISCVLKKYGQEIDLGTFTLTERNLVFSDIGQHIELIGISTPEALPVKTKRSTYYEKRTPYQIAMEIAYKYGFDILLNSKDGYVKLTKENEYNEHFHPSEMFMLDRVEQIEMSDYKFLKKLAKDYGYIFKLKDNLIIFIKNEFEKARYKLTRKDIKYIKIKNVNDYKGCEVENYNPEEKKLVTAHYGDMSGNVLKEKRYFTSIKEGERLAESKLKDMGNRVSGVMELSKERLDYKSGVSFELSEFGVLDGIYRVKSCTHLLNPNGWRVFGDIERIDNLD